jgi:glycosyltransferase involved in cell wall biosynthesis
MPTVTDGPTRVTVVGPAPPISGGIAQHSMRVAEALRARGAEVEVISWASQYPRLLFRGSGVDAGNERPRGVRFMLRWWDPVSWVRAGRVARRGDVLVMQWVTPVHALPQRIIARAARVPMVLIVHNAIPHERMPFDVRLARWIMRRATRVVAHSESVATEVRAMAPGVPVTVAPLPPLLPVHATAPPARPPLRLLCLGFVRAYKGFDVAVDAVRILRDRGIDAHLTIAGEIWEKADEWAQRVADPVLSRDVTLMDRYVSDTEVGRLLAEHHVLVAPYRSATQSGVVSLAFASGRPVVASDVGGLREVVTDGENGRLVPPGDPELLADALAEMVEKFDAYATRAATTGWSWDDVAAGLLMSTAQRDHQHP